MAKTQLNILILDDDIIEIDRILSELKQGTDRFSFVAEICKDAELFRARIAKPPRPDVLLLDVHVDSTAKTSGVDLAKLAKDHLPDTLVVMHSGDMRVVAKSLQAGADDFIDKNSPEGELALRLATSFEAKFPSQANKTPANRSDGLSTQIIGESMQAIANRVPRIIRSAIRAVHVSGESGTGKEVVADLFKNSIPANTPFQKINCGAIQPSLLESELFGYVKGAFTGASADRQGLLQAASGGWIFLDEVANLTLTAQGALLRAIENQEIVRVGDNKVIRINVRVVSATNVSIPNLVASGQFRGDLWQRLCEAEIQLLPLRERPKEIKELAEYFSNTSEGGPYKISVPAMEIICNASWKSGNVRELRNCIRAMTENAVGSLLTPLGIPKRVWEDAEVDSRLESSHAEQLELPLPSQSLDAHHDFLKLSWQGPELPSYSHLEDLLLVEAIKEIARRFGPLSFRQIAKILNISRVTISRRLQEIIDANVVTRAELANYLKLLD